MNLKPIDLYELLSWLTTKKSITAITLERKFGIGHITSNELLDALVTLGFVRRGSFFFTVDHAYILAAAARRILPSAQNEISA